MNVEVSTHAKTANRNFAKSNFDSLEFNRDQSELKLTITKIKKKQKFRHSLQ